MFLLRFRNFFFLPIVQALRQNIVLYYNIYGTNEKTGTDFCNTGDAQCTINNIFRVEVCIKGTTFSSYACMYYLAYTRSNIVVVWWRIFVGAQILLKIDIVWFCLICKKVCSSLLSLLGVKT